MTNKVLPTVFEEDGPVFEDLCKRAFDGEKIMGYELRQKQKTAQCFLVHCPWLPYMMPIRPLWESWEPLRTLPGE